MSSDRKDSHYSHYQWLAYNMAIRHPRVIELLRSLTNNKIPDEIGEELYYDFGLDTRQTDVENDTMFYDLAALILPEWYDIPCYSGSIHENTYPICIPPKKKPAGVFMIRENPIPDIKKALEEELPKKLTLHGEYKDGTVINKIDDGSFRWYDILMKLSNEKKHNIDPSNEKYKQEKKTTAMLNHWISEKRWFELLIKTSSQ